MDMQGKPVSGPSAATKVSPHFQLSAPPRYSVTHDSQHTSDPEAQQNPIQEPTGGLASDSLAAESSREGGAFAANPNATPSKVPGGKSTLATTDDSAARRLDAAPDATAREEKAAWSESADLKGPGGVKYAEGLGGQPQLGGAVGEQGFAGAPSGAESGAGSGTGTGASSGASYANAAALSGSGAAKGSGATSGSSTGPVPSESAGGSTSTHADTAPGYVASVVQGGDGKAKGSNLTEGGFEGEARNNDFEIGSKDDPGRAALQGFQAANSRAAGDVGATQKTMEGGHREYSALNSDEQA